MGDEDGWLLALQFAQQMPHGNPQRWDALMAGLGQAANRLYGRSEQLDQAWAVGAFLACSFADRQLIAALVSQLPPNEQRGRRVLSHIEEIHRLIVRDAVRERPLRVVG